MRNSFQQDTPERQKRFLDDFYLACELAQLTGAKALVLCPPLKADRRTPFEDSTQALHEMNLRIVSRLAREAERSGTKLGFEVVGARYSACRDLAAAKAILDELRLENLGLTVERITCIWERWTAVSAIWPYCVRRIFSSLISTTPTMYLGGVGGSVPPLLPGRGIFGYGCLSAFFAELGYDGVVSVETFRPEYWAKPAEWVMGKHTVLLTPPWKEMVASVAKRSEGEHAHIIFGSQYLVGKGDAL